MSFLGLELFVEDQELNSLFLDKSEYLSSMYARSMEGNNVDGRFILTITKKKQLRCKQNDIIKLDRGIEIETWCHQELALTLVKVRVGKVIPIRKPTITPKKDATSSFIIWLGLLMFPTVLMISTVYAGSKLGYKEVHMFITSLSSQLHPSIRCI